MTGALPDVLRGYEWINAGRGLFPAGSAGVPMEFRASDITAWGRCSLYGDNRTWTVVRLADGRLSCLVLKELGPDVARHARALHRSIGTPSPPAVRWQDTRPEGR